MRDKVKNYLKLTYYTKGRNNNWYCDYYFYNGKEYNTGTTKATVYGYDKESTCVSNAINKYKHLFKRYGKQAKKYKSYGLYEDNSISYGIGISAVLRCIECFKNVKVTEVYEGKHESMIKLEIITD